MATAKTTNAPKNPFDAFAINPDAFKESYEKFAENMSAVADFNKGAMDAVMQSAAAYAKGVEKATSENSEYLKSTYENAMAVGKSVSSANGPQEAFDIQTEFARETIEKNVALASTLADLWIDTGKKTMAPMTERYSELVEKIQSFRP